MTSRVEEIRKELHNLDKSAEFRQWLYVISAVEDDSEFARVLQNIASGYCYDLAFYLCIRYNAVLLHSGFGHFFIECDGLFFDGVTPDGVLTVPELNYFRKLGDAAPADGAILYSVRAAAGQLIWSTSIMVAMRMSNNGVAWIDSSTLTNLDLLRLCREDGDKSGVDLRGSMIYSAFRK